MVQVEFLRPVSLRMTAEKSGYYPLFDFVRAFAAFGVFASHARIIPGGGNACVQVFFALSGYLIGGILLKAKPADLPRFFFNRSARIWIPYALAIAVLAFATLLKQGWHEPKFNEFFAYMLTFTYNWFGPQQLAEFGHRMPLDGSGNQFWSICVEEQFYLVAPFVLLFLPRWVAVSGLVALVGLNVVHPHNFTAISLGVLLAMSTEYQLPITIFLACAAGSIFVTGGAYDYWMPPLAAAIIGTTSLVTGPAIPLATVLGGSSYSFYLNHWIGLFAINPLVNRLHTPHWMAASVGLMIATSLSVAHYFFVDRPLMQHRGKWFSPRIGIALYATGIFLVCFGLILGTRVYDLSPLD